MKSQKIKTGAIKDTLVRNNFGVFVKAAFRHVHGRKLDEQPYLNHLFYTITKLIEGEMNRLLINLPPQHLKSFVATVCFAAYELGKNPHLRIIILAYNDAFAEELCKRVRELMSSDFYQRVFATRIKQGHSRSNDFKTEEGGGVFAASATGAITGRSADLIIYDDPHQMNDWNNERQLDLVWDNFYAILSRLNDKRRGRIIVVAHRVSDKDLSSHLLAENGWVYLRLPLVAVETNTYELGHEEWVREKGDVLRPTEYSASDIAQLQKAKSPPYALFYQQGLDPQAVTRVRADDFQTVVHPKFILSPAVLSIDPGHLGSPNGSRSVIQTWKFHDHNYFLIDQFCEPCDFEALRKAFWRAVKRHKPGVALIENTANGPALASAIRNKVTFKLVTVTPRRDKVERFNHHLPKITGGRVFLPESAIWRSAFISEVVNFPGPFDDQVDAMAQYFDFIDSSPTIPPAPPRTATAAISYARSLTGLRRW